MSISVTHLTKTYGNQVAVNNISFQVGKGEIVGFLGPNGAGKSTTMKMITGFLSPDAGEIKVAGITAMPGDLSIKKKIGYLPEANPLYHDMYIREYLQFIARVHQVARPSAAIDQVITTVGLTPEKHKKIGQLSKGYKQRVGLAAALVHDPEVLILDEPTSGLDPNQLTEIRAVIRSLATHKTILFSSHILQEVEAICDRVIIIDKGNIVADDTLSQLQQTLGNNRQVIVTFREPVPEELISTLPGVIRNTYTPPSTYHITCEEEAAMRQQLLQFSIDKNYDIVSLQSERPSLEAVFRSLTT